MTCLMEKKQSFAGVIMHDQRIIKGSIRCNCIKIESLVLKLRPIGRLKKGFETEDTLSICQQDIKKSFLKSTQVGLGPGLSLVMS